MNVEKFRTLVSDIDWSQTMLLGSGMTTSVSSSGGRQGTFTLEDQEAKQQRPQSALTRGTSPRSSGGAGGSHGTPGGSSRIPTPRASVERSLSGRLSSASSSSSFQTQTVSNSHTTVNQQATTIVDSGPGSNGHSSLNNHDHPALEGEKEKQIGSPIKFSRSTPQHSHTGPLVGMNTEEVFLFHCECT